MEDSKIKGMMRVDLAYYLVLSQTASRKLYTAKVQLHEDNHTDIQVNSRRNNVDVCHEFNENRCVPGIDEQNRILVISGARPWYSRRRYHMLAALFGMNWKVRNLLQSKSTFAQYTFEKHITDIK
jgi:hypothetical protein